ncbi:hypothetical protein L7F22_006007 [Adiantum nelumboides]|nr:hypothetical protein [Adiantum nelumboides]
MADNNEEGRINVDSFDFANEGASEETPMLVNYLITRLQQAMANHALQGEVQQQLQAYGFIPPHQEERVPAKSLGETSKTGISKDTANTIYTDSQGALKVARNPDFYACTKHIKVHYHYVRERLSAGEISLAYVPTQNNLGNLFTKALYREKLEAFRKALSLLPFVD